MPSKLLTIRLLINAESTMSDQAIWLVILAGGVGTYLTRLSFIGLVPQERLPRIFRRGLRFIPSAVLAAILLPEILIPVEAVELSLSNHRLLAGILAAIVAWRLRNTWLTISVGMVALWLLSSL